MSKNNNILQLMHDATGPVNSIKASVTLLKNGSLSKENAVTLLNAMETRANDLNKVLDSFYIANKDIFN